MNRTTHTYHETDCRKKKPVKHSAPTPGRIKHTASVHLSPRFLVTLPSVTCHPSLVSFFLFVLLCCPLSCTFRAGMENTKLMEQAQELMEENPDSALVLIDSMNTAILGHAGKADHILMRVHARDIAELNLKYDNEIFDARDYFTARNDNEKTAWSCLYAAKVLWAQGKNGDAAKELITAAGSAAKTVNRSLQGLIKYNMGVLYFKQAQYQEAADHFKEAYPCFETGQSKFWNRHKVRSLELTALSYMYLSAADSVFCYHNKALADAVLYNDTVGQVDIYINTAAAYCMVKDYDAANAGCRQALTLMNRTDSVSLAKIYLNIVNIYRSTGRKDSAYTYLNRAHNLLQNAKESKDVAWLYQSLSSVEEENGDYPAALLYHKQFTQHLEKVYTETADKDVLDIQKRHRNEQLQQELKRQKQQKWLWIAGLTLVAVISGLAVNSRRVRAKNKALEKEQEYEAQIDLYRQLSEKVRESEKETTVHGAGEKELIRQLHLAFDMMGNLKQIDGLANPPNQKTQSQIKKIFEQINPDSFICFVNKHQQEFAGRLNREYPGLSEQEYRICCLFHFGFSLKAIALIMDLAVSTVRQRRSDIRKKASLDERADLEDFFKSLDHDQALENKT